MFVHLHVHTPFSFLDGASRIEDLIQAAASFGMPALAVTDHDNLSAAVRFHRTCEQAGIKPIIGAEVTLRAGTQAAYTRGCAAGPCAAGTGRDLSWRSRVPRAAYRAARPDRCYAPTGLRTPFQLPGRGDSHLTLLARNSRGYANLCRLLSRAHLSQPRLQPAASWEALQEYSDDLIALSGCRRGEVPSLILQRRFAEAEAAARRCRDLFGPERFFLEMQSLLLPGDKALHARLAELAGRLGIGLVATNNVHHLRREDFPVHDVLTCARTLTKLDDIHPERRLNAQCYFRSPAEMKESFRDHPPALEAAARIADMCEPALHPGKYCFPAAAAQDGESGHRLLRRLAEQGARRRYGRIGETVRRRLRHELSVIRQLGFEDYFLAVWDLVQFARREGIRYAGRGSAADSLVAYCLGITSVDPVARGLLFERFMSLERAAPPDIDLDFQAERRDEVTKYVIGKYGPEHVAGVATYNTFQARSAVRDLGKAMGLPAEDLDYLAKRLPHMPADVIAPALEQVPELRDSAIPRERFVGAGKDAAPLLEICRAVAGFPRHLATHLGGLVITGQPISDISPLQMAAKGVPIIQFDKDDVEDLGLVKLDLLCLRMLSAVEQATRSIRARDGSFDYEAIPPDDRASYELIASTETVGVFQLESPAQRALHARLQPERFEDLVASVAIIRPGPILANMVDPYLERRAGRQPVTYLHPALERILAKTYGVVLFQEQVIEIAIAIAGFTPGEADQLRRAMTHHRSWEEMERIGAHFVQRAEERGVNAQVAQEIFSYIRAYAGYGFCEAHAAAFADTAYRTAYLKAHYPAEFYAALLSCQPMGFYPPNTLLWEAKRKGIAVLGPDINRSDARFTVEEDDGQVVGSRSSYPSPFQGEDKGGGERASPCTLTRPRLVEADLSPSTSSGQALTGRGISRGAWRAPSPPNPATPGKPALRVGLAQIQGMGEGALNRIIAARKQGPFQSLEDFCRRVRVDRDLARNLILCGAMDSLHSNRRQALWRLDAAPAPAGASRAANPTGEEVGARHALPLPLQWRASETEIPDFSPREKWRYEWDLLGLALREHPVGLIRERLRRQGVVTAAQARRGRNGQHVKVTGLVIMPHRPPTRSGRTVVFFTLEDETGLLDVTVFESVYQRCGAAIFTRPLITIAGRLDRRGGRAPAPAPASLIADHIA